MSSPSTRISPDDVRAYARVWGIDLADGELAAIADQLLRLRDELRALWEVDVSGHEMALIFPIEPLE